jgi:hypothetical protein
MKVWGSPECPLLAPTLVEDGCSMCSVMRCAQPRHEQEVYVVNYGYLQIGQVGDGRSTTLSQLAPTQKVAQVKFPRPSSCSKLSDHTVLVKPG